MKNTPAVIVAAKYFSSRITYTVTAWPPKVYRMLVAPVKYKTLVVGAE
jgi:hypothetical protein